MPEYDVTGKVVQHGIQMMLRLRKRFQEHIPYGPLRSYMTTKEARLRLQEVDPGTKAQFRERGGDEEWRRMMEDLYGNKL